MKIFEFNQGQKGTLIDSVSKTAGTLSAGGFRKTEKGNALYCDGSSVKVSYPASTPLSLDSNVFSIEGYFKIDSPTTWATIFDNRDDNNVGVEIICTNQKKLSLRINNLDVDGATTLVDNKYYHFVATYNGSVGNLYLNNNLDKTLTKAETIAVNGDIAIGGRAYTTGEMFKGFIGNVKIYDHVLSEQERNTLYEQFLQASPTEKPVRGFEYPKPTDLSRTTGLVAAYNMVPNGNTLVDISGNGNNGTIYGALSTKDGLSFNNKGYVDLGSSNAVNIGKTFSVSWRGTVNNPLNDMVIYGGNYIRVSSPTTLTTFFGSSADNLIIPALKDNEEYTFTVTRNEQEVKWYINGSYAGGYTSTANDDLIYKLIGCVNLSTQLYSGVMNDLRIMSYAFTAEQAKAYHNSFVKPVLLIDFSDEAVGNTI